MPVPSYLTIVGEQQGLISAGAGTEDSVGSIWQAGREDQIMVQSCGHRMSVDKGPSGGKRMHHPLTFSKVVDKSTPLINAALCNREPLKTCRLEVYRISSVGGLQYFYTIELHGGLIMDVELVIPDCQNPALAHYTQIERVQIAYRDITWSHEVCRTTAYDTWCSEGNE